MYVPETEHQNHKVKLTWIEGEIDNLTITIGMFIR